jgi:ABC-type uncharacterized transport system substrate-binding protein
MNRREFISLLGGAAAAWPLAARAQQPAMPSIGLLSARSQRESESAGHVAAFRHGLGEMGFLEGHNIAIEYRWAEGHNDRLAALAVDLVRLRVTVIAALGGNNSAVAARAATRTIPIVFTSGADPVKVGLVGSLNRPGANITGISWFAAELGPKRLGLLHELMPHVTAVALILNPNSPEFAGQAEAAREAAGALGWKLEVVLARSASELDAAFDTAMRQGTQAVVLGADPFYISQRDQIVAAARRHALPAIYPNREFVTAGGLMSYGNSVADAYRRAGLHVARLLKGAKPSELPVDQAVKFELLLNLKTARSLGLDVPPTLLARADEVIE